MIDSSINKLMNYVNIEQTFKYKIYTVTKTFTLRFVTMTQLQYQSNS